MDSSLHSVSLLSLAVLIGSLVLLSGCGTQPSSSQEMPARLTDADYMTADLWNDGQAEVAFYRVTRSENQYGQAQEQQFMVGTYLVKHAFDPETMSKTTEPEQGVSSFKYALFYEFESGSYQYKRNYVLNARQRDLRPYKQSFTSFDWCSNQYIEFAFHPDDVVDYLMRSDDYGNTNREFSYEANAYPPAALPLLVRGFDFSSTTAHSFRVILDDGSRVSAQAERVGTDSVMVDGASLPAEEIRVTYDRRVPSLIAEETDMAETYWRGTGPERLLLQVRSTTGRYTMTLVEQLRTAYWSDNLWPMLERVRQRP